MKKRSLALVLCLSLCLTVVLCACGKEPSEPTVITKAPGQVAIRTTVPQGGQPDGGESTGTTVPTTRPSVVIGEEGSTELGEAIAELAISLIGTEFKFGANGPDAFDNPSFVVYCYKQFGYTVPRKASSMMTWGEDAPPDELQVGDILLFCNEIGEEAGFCAIYIGDNKFVACYNPNSPTAAQKLNVSYWTQRFLGARRAPQAEE